MGRALWKIWRKIDETILPYLPSQLMSQLIFKAYVSQRQIRNVSFLPLAHSLAVKTPPPFPKKKKNKEKNLDIYEEGSVHV
jgi:hypothetical protein